MLQMRGPQPLQQAFMLTAASAPARGGVIWHLSLPARQCIRVQLRSVVLSEVALALATGLPGHPPSP